jgi:hypothetical protein
MQKYMQYAMLSIHQPEYNQVCQDCLKSKQNMLKHMGRIQSLIVEQKWK